MYLSAMQVHFNYKNPFIKNITQQHIIIIYAGIAELTENEVTISNRYIKDQSKKTKIIR